MKLGKRYRLTSEFSVAAIFAPRRGTLQTFAVYIDIDGSEEGRGLFLDFSTWNAARHFVNLASQEYTDMGFGIPSDARLALLEYRAAIPAPKATPPVYARSKRVLRRQLNRGRELTMHEKAFLFESLLAGKKLLS